MTLSQISHKIIIKALKIHQNNPIMIIKYSNIKVSQLLKLIISKKSRIYIIHII